MKKCKYNSCKAKATHTWALVDLCEDHYEMVKDEVNEYYRKRIFKNERAVFQKIKKFTPWG